MKRESWGSKIGFILAVAGSAIGLANIWRFPYIAGSYGGAAFVIIYLLCLLLIGFPTFIAELLMGRATQSSPGIAFRTLGQRPGWGWMGRLTIFTGFIVSSFYSAVAGWVLGYLVEAIRGELSHFESSVQAAAHYSVLVENPWWAVGFHFLFLFLATSILFFGVRKGIERGNKILMPLLFLLLLFLVSQTLLMPRSGDALQFLFAPRWDLLTPAGILIAMGQAFFTLSAGQGTLVTYGSYLPKNENLVGSGSIIVGMDTLVSIFASMIVFPIVFSVGMQPDCGPGLIFHTLPVAFSQISGGAILAVLFFLLVSLAALTSEVSAMEPTIAYLVDEWGWKRRTAAITCGVSAFIAGIPCALSYNLLKECTFFGSTILDAISFIACSIFIPIGGFCAVAIVGWVWGTTKAIAQLQEGAQPFFHRNPWLARYFWFCFKYSAPILIIVVLLAGLW